MADDLGPTVELMENPLSGETMVEEFTVSTARTHEEVGWQPSETSSHRLSAGPTPRSRESCDGALSFSVVRVK